MTIERYSDRYKSIWNRFVIDSKNGHFFFLRDYMEYHSERFQDFSLLCFDERDRLVAILPANMDNGTLHSHQGLTFGGFIVNEKMRVETMLTIFINLKIFLKEWGIARLVYKSIPYIYHIKPSEEDRYGLFINGARLIRRDITSTINLSENIKYSKGRKWSLKRARKMGIQLSKSNNYANFWTLLSNVLRQNHNSNPIHTVDEMERLADLFPNNIKLYTAQLNGELLSGAVIYENRDIVHTQYLANSQLGREIGALDLLLDYLIKEVYVNKRYFDFGTSNENGGRYLNMGLISQKEGFGARAVAHDFYEWEIK